MSNNRFYVAAFAIVYDWKVSVDPTRRPVDVHITNEDELVQAIAIELEREHDVTKTGYCKES